MLPEQWQEHIIYKTSRSGGKGGQNVNKVESQVEGHFQISGNPVFTAEQEALLLQRLSSKLTKEGVLIVRSQTHRSQHSNKWEVTQKIGELLEKALHRPKARKATKPTAASRQRTLENKKKRGAIKTQRRKNYFDRDD